jgi:hypothetical protein
MQPQSFEDVKYTRLLHDVDSSIPRSFLSKAMPLLKSAFAALAVAAIYYTASTSARAFSVPPPTCTKDDLAVMSCSAQANQTDSCCVENPGGLLLLTQLYNSKLGPANSWTIHGLWGDFCNGVLQFTAKSYLC